MKFFKQPDVKSRLIILVTRLTAIKILHRHAALIKKHGFGMLVTQNPYSELSTELRPDSGTTFGCYGAPLHLLNGIIA